MRLLKAEVVVRGGGFCPEDFLQLLDPSLNWVRPLVIDWRALLGDVVLCQEAFPEVSAELGPVVCNYSCWVATTVAYFFFYEGYYLLALCSREKVSVASRMYLFFFPLDG